MVGANGTGGMYRSDPHTSRGPSRWPAGLGQLGLSLEEQTHAELCHRQEIIVPVYLASAGAGTSGAAGAGGGASGGGTAGGGTAGGATSLGVGVPSSEGSLCLEERGGLRRGRGAIAHRGS